MLVRRDDQSNGQPKRCLWLTKGLGRGGVERLLVDMYPLVESGRFDVEVAYVLPWKDAHREDLEAAGAKVHCLGVGSRPQDPRWLGSLDRLVRHGEYDLIHTHAPIPAAGVRLLARRAGRPAIVHTEHNMWSRYRRPTRFVNAWTYAKNDTVIAVSKVVADSIGPVPLGTRPPVTIVHHGTDLGRIVSYSVEQRAAGRQRLNLPADAQVVGSVGNFTAKKNQDMLLRALSRTADVHLVLVGSGPLERELRATVDRLDLTDRVTFLGSRDDVLELLPLFDVFALSSRFEGFPIALVEAMATGLACVTTAAGGIAEIVVDGESGLLVPDDDDETMASALLQALNPSLASSLADGAKRAAAALDLSQAVDSMSHLYEAALGAPARLESNA